MSASLNKSALRAQFRAARLAVSSNDRAFFAENAAAHLRESLHFQQAKTVACYLSMPDEFDTAPILQTLLKANKQCYLPALTPEKTLNFLRYEAGDELVPNQFNILEPVYDARNCLEPSLLDLVLIPLVAFDQHGHRLGAGGGYYDRTFAFLQKQAAQTPYLVGVAYQRQATKDLPALPHDVRLQAVLTEAGLLHFT